MKQTQPFTTLSYCYLTWTSSFTTTCEVSWSLILFSRPGDPREREAIPTGFSNGKLEDLEVRVTWLKVPWRLLLPEKPFNWQTFMSHPPNQQRGLRVFTGRFASGKFFPFFLVFFSPKLHDSWDLSSPTRDWTPGPWREIPSSKCWTTTREFPSYHFCFYLSLTSALSLYDPSESVGGNANFYHNLWFQIFFPHLFSYLVVGGSGSTKRWLGENFSLPTHQPLWINTQFRLSQ